MPFAAALEALARRAARAVSAEVAHLAAVEACPWARRGRAIRGDMPEFAAIVACGWFPLARTIAGQVARAAAIKALRLDSLGASSIAATPIASTVARLLRIGAGLAANTDYHGETFLPHKVLVACCTHKAR